MYKHSVELDVMKCTGCTTCLRHCPTEAIRIRDGHAVINEDRCIDCGECIRVCPNNAKKAMCSKFEHYQYTIKLYIMQNKNISIYIIFVNFSSLSNTICVAFHPMH